MDVKTKLSTLWIIIMLNMIFADIFSIIIALGDPSVMDIPGDPRQIMAIAAVVTNIPISMIFLSRYLSNAWSRRMNLVASLLTIVYVVGGGSAELHYWIIGGIEVTLLGWIAWSAYTWKVGV
ncbi:MAG: DUF6326 family protein [Bacteroidota bacterium]